MPTPKTSWEDLARLGWPINSVYLKANAARGSTMSTRGDLTLNEGLAAEYQWWSYNTTIGLPYVLGTVPKDITREETAWSYDNTQNSEPFSEEWTESWTNTNTATLTISTSASITLSANITIFDVASSGFDITISSDNSSSETEERSYNLSHTWPMDVGPYEKLSLIRVITTSSEVTDYGQDFGLEPNSLCGTNGSLYNGHYHWGMYLNTLCNSPRGRMNLQGSSKVITHSFKLIREGAEGRTGTPLAVDLQRVVKDKNTSAKPPPAVIEKWAAKMKAADESVQGMIPGP